MRIDEAVIVEEQQAVAPGGTREFSFTDSDFQQVRELLAGHAGIVLSDIKQDMAYNRLARRLRFLGLSSVSDYLQLLNDPVKGEQEFGDFINAMTTNLTAFFREAHHFNYLKQTLVPEFSHSRKGPIKIWSAGCSVGEEPYSLAITLDEVMREGQSARILATDIDTQVLDTARRGEYDQERVGKLPNVLLKRSFFKGKGKYLGGVKIKPHLQAMVTFKALNLMEPWPMKQPFDAIFCRNVMIYFDKPTQARLLNRMADLLTVGGHLFIGHSESLHGTGTRFKSVGQTIYQRRN